MSSSCWLEAAVPQMAFTEKERTAAPIAFISYSAKDERLAAAIHAFLNQAGVVALKAPDDIAPGTDWAAAITTMIERCTHMVLVWTSNSMASQEVSKELTLAMQCGAVIIPFRSENLAPDGAWRYHLSHVQWLEAHGMPEGQALEALARQVGGGVVVSKPAALQPMPVVAGPTKLEDAPASVASRYSPAEVRRRKTTAALLALFFGSLGIHKFYLGRILPGCIQLGLWVFLIILAVAFGSEPEAPANDADGIIGLLGLLLLLLPFAEAITYLTRRPGDFERINLAGKRNWF